MEAEYGDEPSQLHYVFIFAGLWVWVWVVMATKKRLSLYICGKRGRQSHGVNSELESGRKEIIIDHKRCFSFGSSTWNLKGTPLESLDIVWLFGAHVVWWATYLSRSDLSMCSFFICIFCCCCWVRLFCVKRIPNKVCDGKRGWTLVLGSVVGDRSGLIRWIQKNYVPSKLPLPKYSCFLLPGMHACMRLKFNSVVGSRLLSDQKGIWVIIGGGMVWM